MSFEEIRVITIVYLAVLLPLVIYFTNKSKIPSWIPSFYIVSIVVCALGWELWFNYGWLDGDAVNIRRSEALNTWLPKNINWCELFVNLNVIYNSKNEFNFRKVIT